MSIALATRVKELADEQAELKITLYNFARRISELEQYIDRVLIKQELAAKPKGKDK